MEEGLNHAPLTEAELKEYSPLTLAYLGDAVFGLLARELVVREGNRAPEKLHKKATDLVKAETQAIMAHGLKEELTEEEFNIYRRGRNAQSYTHAKNAKLSDYRHATGLEALFGYLHLKGETKRMEELMLRCLAIYAEHKENTPSEEKR